MTDPRRSIPGLDRILESEEAAVLLQEYPRERAVEAIRRAVDSVRAAVAAGASFESVEQSSLYLSIAREALLIADRPSLIPVINGTGVVLHTNLGRAPLAAEALTAIQTVGAGYSNLEFDLVAGARGSRYDHCVSLLKELTGAEDALVVNNCAAALVLILSALARDEGVLVSRGELIEIGGGFRIPEILEQSGARLVEVGSTNRTRLADYAAELDAERPTVILKVHRSNFRISGFTEEAELAELVQVAAEAGIVLVHDLGSGLLIDAERLGLPHEPTPSESLEAGVDIVAFSGDKLMGGPQAGIIVGKAEHLAALRRCPLCRALRVDKITLSALEATLRLYRDPERAIREVPTLSMLSSAAEDLAMRANQLVAELAEVGVSGEAETCSSVVGGGTYPGVELPSRGVRISVGKLGVQAVAAALRKQDPPIVGRVDDDGLHFDVRTVLPGQHRALVQGLATVLTPKPDP